jgi:hypothetical protein
MVQDAKSENLPNLGQLLVHAEVRFARLKFARWVVVREDDGCRAIGNDIRKHFSRGRLCSGISLMVFIDFLECLLDFRIYLHATYYNIYYM